ncbi:MAG: zinc-ribbon domain-containing protein, partial [Candidatus Bathyarchaeia archaeon]
MPYCRECGKEVGEEAAFCPSCGAPLKEREVIYRRPVGSGWGAARIMAALIGGLMIVASIGMMAGGGGIVWFQRAFGTP